MSWYTDPQLFIYRNSSPGTRISRITSEYSDRPLHLQAGNFIAQGYLDFHKHLSRAGNKESDFDAFKTSFPTSGDAVKFINSQGLVVHWYNSKSIGVWSREEPNSPFYSLPGIAKTNESPLADKHALDKENSGLKAEIVALKAANATLTGDNTSLKNKENKLTGEINKVVLELNQEKKDKQAIEKQVLELKSKLEEFYGAGGGGSEPWVTDHAIPSNWVPFEELDVLSLPKNTPSTLIISKKSSALVFAVEDNTTNVKVNRFCQGIFPTVLVNVGDLMVPSKEKARFDPAIWGLYTNAGIQYAARKLLQSEMSVKKP